MLIVADENIPFAEETFGAYGTVLCLPGRTLSAEDARDADALLVRSVTQVGRSLLEGSGVQFVGSATIGTDHVDAEWLREAGIAFAHAPGSNAGSVAEYVLAALLRLATRRGEALAGRTVGVVGCGNVGGEVARRLEALGACVLRCDPPLAEAADARGEAHGFVSLSEVLTTCDTITLHTPLTREGAHATRHLIGARELAALRPGAWLLNTSRGEVLDNTALAARLDAEPDALGALVLDVWEGEPAPRADLIRRADLATPHIAGYSFDGKVRGTLMLAEAFAEALGEPPLWDAHVALEEGAGDDLVLVAPDASLGETAYLDALARQMYDIEADDSRMRPLAEMDAEARGEAFAHLRKTYPRRRAFERHRLAGAAAYRTTALSFGETP